MKHVVKEGKTLLIDGPASLTLLKGDVRVLGAAIRAGEKIIVREGKRVPIEVSKKTVLDLTLGGNALLEEVDGSTTPPSWERDAKKIISYEKPVAVMVIGGIDSGKTSFCVYLANWALKKKRNVAVIDADLGQSDIGPPSTIGFGHVTAPIMDLFEMEAENAHFVGVTSPSGAVERVVEGITALKSKVLETGTDFLIINTDGWIGGEDAVNYKVRLVERVAPDVVVGIQQEKELTPILIKLKNTSVFELDSPPAIRRRSREKRKILRELSYKKYLKGARVHSFPLKWVNIEGTLLGNGRPFTAERIEKIRKALEETPFHCEETPTTVLIVLKGDKWVDEEQIKIIEGALGKKARVINKGEEEGLLAALQDAKGNFLGIGILSSIDYKKRSIKIYTPVDRDVATVCVGQIKLDKNGREVGLSRVLRSD